MKATQITLYITMTLMMGLFFALIVFNQAWAAQALYMTIAFQAGLLFGNALRDREDRVPPQDAPEA